MREVWKVFSLLANDSVTLGSLANDSVTLGNIFLLYSNAEIGNFRFCSFTLSSLATCDPVHTGTTKN